MQHLTLFEAKQLAAYLKTSTSLVPQHSENLKHGQWLNMLACSCGYRDWNAMSAVAPEVPDTEWGNWYRAFFVIARVLPLNGEVSEHFVWFREGESNRFDAGKKLAKSVLAQVGSRLRGSEFKYSRPDTPEYPIEVTTIERARKWSKHPWYASAPLVLVSSDGGTKILLWWLQEMYTMAEHYPNLERKFSYQSLSFNDGVWPTGDWVNEISTPRSLTDQFIFDLTGIELPKRTCFYVTEVPNGPADSFIPLEVREGDKDAKLLDLNWGRNRYDALESALLLNFANGVTKADGETISQVFRQYEPQEEDWPMEFMGHSDD